MISTQKITPESNAFNVYEHYLKETENEMVGWRHQLNGHEFEQTPGDSGGQDSLRCCSP